MEEQAARAVAHGSAFRVKCETGLGGQFQEGSDSLSIVVSQRIRHLGTQGMWESVLIEGKAE